MFRLNFCSCRRALSFSPPHLFPNPLRAGFVCGLLSCPTIPHHCPGRRFHQYRRSPRRADSIGDHHRAAVSRKTQILSLGFGGSLIVGFNSPISNNPANPFGLDFTVFNNSFLELNGANITTNFTHPGLRVYVSQDDVNFYLLSSSTNNGAGDMFPTEGSGNPFQPINPSLSLSSFVGGHNVECPGMLYNGSAGGSLLRYQCRHRH